MHFLFHPFHVSNKNQIKTTHKCSYTILYHTKQHTKEPVVINAFLFTPVDVSSQIIPIDWRVVERFSYDFDK